jgi:hypothetical protein
MKIRHGLYWIAGGLGIGGIGALGLIGGAQNYAEIKAEIPERFFELREELRKYEGNSFHEGLRQIMQDEEALQAYQELAAEYQTYDLEEIRKTENRMDCETVTMLAGGAWTCLGVIGLLIGAGGVFQGLENRFNDNMQKARKKEEER